MSIVFGNNEELVATDVTSDNVTLTLEAIQPIVDAAVDAAVNSALASYTILQDRKERLLREIPKQDEFRAAIRQYAKQVFDGKGNTQELRDNILQIAQRIS
jgi:hypothetical protein